MSVFKIKKVCKTTRGVIIDMSIKYELSKILPDSIYLKLFYKMIMGKSLDLKNPQTFNEKIQWLKLYDRKPIYTTMVDKIAAKSYVAAILGKQYIIPTLGVWDNFDDIDFDKLPNQFVLKCNHDSGGLVIVRNKSELNLEMAKTKIERCLKKNYFYVGREWPYKNVKPQIFAEKYLETSPLGIRDYKFFNFNGLSKFMYVSEGLEDHKTARISFFDFEGHQLPFKRLDYRPFEGDCNLPENFEKMHSLSDKLAQQIGNAFVRTDFYSINDNIYFSEITFSPCSGMLPFDPIEWDKILGEWIQLPE